MPKTARKTEDHFYEKISIFFILGLAFILRVWGIRFGLPDLFHADEPIVVNHALAYGTGDFNPHFFKIPPLVSYLLFIVYGLYFLVFRSLGWFKSAQDFQNLFFSDPSYFYFLARLIFGALLGTATVYLLYKLARKFFSKEHALLSSFFLAVAFLHVRDSHFIYVDIPLLFVLLVCFIFIFRIGDNGLRRDYLLFALLLGTAVATKYNGVFVFVPFLTAHFLGTAKKKSGLFNLNLLLVCLISAATFGLLNPYSWLDPGFFFRELLHQSRSEGGTHFFHHLIYSLNGGLGFPLLGLSVWGVGRSFFVSDKKRWILISFVIVYYLVLCFFSQPYDRYALPLIPFLAFFAADGLLALKERFHFSRASIWILAFVLACPSLAKVYWSDQIFSREDIRTVVRKRIEEVIPDQAKIALDVPFFMPRLKPTLKQLVEKKQELLSPSAVHRAQFKRLDWMIEQAQNDRESRYELYFLTRGKKFEGFLFAQPAVPYDVKQLRNLGVQYVIVAKISDQFEPQFYVELRTQAILLARFSPYRDESRQWAVDPMPLTGGVFLWKELIGRERNGQIIEVYKLN